MLAVGSSPRVRGKHRARTARSRRRRIIPASAGQTIRRSRRALCPADHPRECGANYLAVLGGTWRYGSSPRVRGKHALDPDYRLRMRIIPASAGQTSTCLICASAAADHPRECGANAWLRSCPAACSGSSPRVRGKPFLEGHRRGLGRIIPASAGQTTPHCDGIATSTDHPRECGANEYVTPAMKAEDGSSPRVRGKRHARGNAGLATRIIPASAGQTSSTAVAYSSAADHPRECGANVRRAPGHDVQNGSSPRVRGKHGMPPMARMACWIIPASAGQTFRVPAAVETDADHPRECGANHQVRGGGRAHAGSSPRVRGKRPMPMGGLGPRRIIPASAGQTSC